MATAGMARCACDHLLMAEDDPDGESFEETLRSIAGEVARFVERSVEGLDVDRFAESTGVDPDAARDWLENAGNWLRANTEHLGEELARRVAGPGPSIARSDPLEGAGPHPLDVPSEDQGLALAALDSGRWTVEPGTGTLTAHGEGPAPHAALGIVRELRARDWIMPDGELTVAGRYALSRWLESATSR
jgi:hypothetical protein